MTNNFRNTDLLQKLERHPLKQTLAKALDIAETFQGDVEYLSLNKDLSPQGRHKALQEFLAQHPVPEPYLPLQKIDAGDSGADCLIRESGARVEPGVDAVLHSPSCLLR
jgi:hypothetical protein